MSKSFDVPVYYIQRGFYKAHCLFCYVAKTWNVVSLVSCLRGQPRRPCGACETDEEEERKLNIAIWWWLQPPPLPLSTTVCAVHSRMSRWWWSKPNLNNNHPLWLWCVLSQWIWSACGSAQHENKCGSCMFVDDAGVKFVTVVCILQFKSISLQGMDSLLWSQIHI